jgi:hypothetical protein
MIWEINFETNINFGLSIALAPAIKSSATLSVLVLCDNQLTTLSASLLAEALKVCIATLIPRSDLQVITNS